MRYIPAIDGLRAIAVVAVVFFHADIAGFGGGYVGVDVFFVISGYLITKLIVDKPSFSLWDFYERRARRILPALGVVVLVCSVFAYVLFIPEDLKAYGESAMATALFSSNILFWYETGYFDAPAALKPLLHTWSLAVEEQLYIVYPLVLMACARFLRKRWLLVMLPLGVASFVLCELLIDKSPAAAFYLMPTRAWEFLMGALIAVGFVPAVTNRAAREVLGVVGLGLLAFSITAYSSDTTFPGWAAIPPCLGAAILIWLSLQESTVATQILATRTVVFVGLVSYSFYLWHWPVLVFAEYAALQPLPLLARLGLVLLAFLLAILTWRYVELPVRRGAYWDSRRTLIGSAVGIAGCLLIGLVAFATQGLPARLSPQLQALRGAAHDRLDCHRVTVKRVDEGNICIRGAAGVEPSFVLLGDSHADALSPGVFAGAVLAQVSGYQFTAPGFRPLLNIKRNHELTERFVQFLEEHPSVKLVILEGFWTFQATGGSYRRKVRAVFRDDQYDGSGFAYNTVSFRRGIQQLVDKFPDRNFLLVEDFPVGRELSIAQARRKFYLQQLLHGDSNFESARFGIARALYDEQRATYGPVFKRVSKAQNVLVVPLVNVLCDEDFCSGANGAELFFRDGDHLSEKGGLLFSEMFRDIFLAQKTP